MPLPDLSPLCIHIAQGPGELCITFPGGGTLCAQWGLEFGDPSEITRALFAQINAALMPLIPIFNLIDVAKAIVDCIQAIPDAIGPPPDVTAIAQCIPDLVEKLEALLALLPQVSIPVLVRALITALIMTLSGMKADLLAIIRQQARIVAAATLAAEPGNVQLQIVLDCATGNLDAQLQNLNATLMPLNRLLGVVNLLMELAGLEPLPNLSELGDDAKTALTPIDDAIVALQTAQAALPAGP